MSDKPQGKPVAPAASGVSMEVILALGAFIVISGGAGISFAFLENETFLNAVHRVHSILVTTATIISMLAFVVIIYAFMRISEISTEETRKLGLILNWSTEKKQKNERWHRVEEYMTSLNPSDWKIAILEADNILDQVVERMGYDGVSLGERMKKIEASDFPYLEEAWTAHKTRNAIAHKGTDYPLNRSEAEQTINIYHRIFKELGYL
jgi:hypothetical protein